MRFQKAIKKIIALGTGATMLGATLMSAYGAADLANYPSPFIKDGKFNGVLVVGNKAAAEDVIGVTDIAMSLQAAAVKPASTSTSSVGVEGDAWQVKTSSKMLDLSEDMTAGTSHKELLSDVSNFISASELKSLGSGKVTTTKATSPYNQYLYLLGPTSQRLQDSGYVQYTEDSDTSVSADFLYFRSSREIGRYLLEFTTALESDVEDSAGSASSTGLYLGDFEDVELNVFGKAYTIVTARRTTTVGNNVKLTLMGGAKRDSLLEKATKTYNVNGKDYEVTLNFVDSDEAQFIVNAASSNKLKDGDTQKLFPGTKDEITIGVSSILYQDYAGGIHSATFFIGAQKIELKDTDVTDKAGYSDALKVDDNSIDGTYVSIEGTDNNSTFKINRINLNMTADDHYFVPANGKLSEAIKTDGDEEQVIFTNNWDIEYKGLSSRDKEKSKIITSGSSQYVLEFQDGDGKTVKLPYARAPTGSQLSFGDSSSRAVINAENNTIFKDDYFVLTDQSSSRKRGERKTYVLQYRGSSKVSSDSPVLKFRNLGSQESIELPFSNKTVTTIASPHSNPGPLTELATLKVGGSDFIVWGADAININDLQIVVDLDASGSVPRENTTIPITTRNGLEINVTNITGTSGDDMSDIVRVTFRVPDESKDGTARDSTQTNNATVVRLNITAASAKVQFALDTTTEANRLNLRTPSGKTNVAYGYDAYGSYYTHETPTNDPATMTVEVPDKQVEALVYITTKGSAFTTSGVSEGSAVTVQRIEVGATKLASEVSDIKSVNSILVGGPCANTATSTVMGNPADCTAGFEPGVGMIKLYENGDKLAMVVAGATAMDTRNTATVVANYKDYKAQLKGTNVEVRKTTSGTLTVAAPAAKTATTTTTTNTTTVATT